MNAAVGALGSGILFGFGLAVSGMSDPSNVLAFLTLSIGWRPDLLVVMGSAFVVAALGYRKVLSKAKPRWTDEFHIPDRKDIDARLVAGAIVFGIGWGFSGYCPGPALVGAFALDARALQFLIAFFAGAMFYELVTKYLSTHSAPAIDGSRGDG